MGVAPEFSITGPGMAGRTDIEALIKKLEGPLEGGAMLHPNERIHPERVALYGGISGITLAVPEFQMASGLIVRDTYAHVMAPYLMAFAKPPRAGAPHPVPWIAAGGGLGFDVTIEIGLSLGAQPTSIDRLNTLWWVLALFRLISGAAIRMPVISNIPFAVIPTSSLEPTLWTIEMLPHQLPMMKTPPVEISLTLLEWVRDVLVPGATLLNDSNFNRAFQTFDGAIWLRSFGSAILMVWASIETLFRPGRRDITKILAASVARAFSDRIESKGIPESAFI